MELEDTLFMEENSPTKTLMLNMIDLDYYLWPIEDPILMDLNSLLPLLNVLG